MSETAYPLGRTAGETPPVPMYQDEWRSWGRALGDGIINAWTSEGMVFANSGTTVTIHSYEAIIQGIYYQLDGSLNLDLASFGTSGTTGQHRWDAVVLRFDPTASTLANRVRTTVRAGTWATNAVRPALSRSSSGVWEMPLAWVHRTYGAAVSQTDISNSTRYIASPVVGRSDEILANPEIYPLGSTLIVGNQQFTRTLTSGTAVWLGYLPRLTAVVSGSEFKFPGDDWVTNTPLSQLEEPIDGAKIEGYSIVTPIAMRGRITAERRFTAPIKLTGGPFNVNLTCRINSGGSATGGGLIKAAFGTLFPGGTMTLRLDTGGFQMAANDAFEFFCQSSKAGIVAENDVTSTRFTLDPA